MLEGEIEVRTPLERDALVKLELVCTRSVTTGSGKHQRTTTEPLWSEEWQASPQPRGEGRGCRIPVCREIPDNAEESTLTSGITWTLRASAEVAGADFVALFEVPVFRRLGELEK